MKKCYLEPELNLTADDADIITSSIATEGEKDPYKEDKNWEVLFQ